MMCITVVKQNLVIVMSNDSIIISSTGKLSQAAPSGTLSVQLGVFILAEWGRINPTHSWGLSPPTVGLITPYSWVYQLYQLGLTPQMGLINPTVVAYHPLHLGCITPHS
jgi:hypothetical protein